MSFRNNRSTMEELLELYEEEDLLWNTMHEHYHRKDKRKQALNRISSMVGLPVSEVNKKLTNMRTYYGKEINKIKRSKARKSKGEEVYVSRWDYFNILDRFLFPFVQGRKTIEDSSEEGDSEGDDADITDAKQEDTGTTGTTDAHSLIPRKRKHHGELPSPIISAYRTRPSSKSYTRQSDSFKEHNIVDQSAEGPGEAETRVKMPVKALLEDREDIFGRHVANELRLVTDLRARQLVKLKIQNLLFEAQFGSQDGTQPCVPSANGSVTDVHEPFQVLPEIDEKETHSTCNSDTDVRKTESDDNV